MSLRELKCKDGGSGWQVFLTQNKKNEMKNCLKSSREG